ncbi:Tudor-knot domain-containing protein [Mammaliicoccus sciuri]|nr:hypothetical protein [Mammaliicoccus sciuri]
MVLKINQTSKQQQFYYYVHYSKFNDSNL